MLDAGNMFPDEIPSHHKDQGCGVYGEVADVGDVRTLHFLQRLFPMQIKLEFEFPQM